MSWLINSHWIFYTHNGYLLIYGGKQQIFCSKLIILFVILRPKVYNNITISQSRGLAQVTHGIRWPTLLFVICGCSRNASSVGIGLCINVSLEGRQSSKIVSKDASKSSCPVGIGFWRIVYTAWNTRCFQFRCFLETWNPILSNQILGWKG